MRHYSSFCTWHDEQKTSRPVCSIFPLEMVYTPDTEEVGAVLFSVDVLIGDVDETRISINTEVPVNADNGSPDTVHHR